MNFLFEDTKDKTGEEQEELFHELTEKALSGDHNEFEYIKNSTEWRIMRATKKGLKKIIELYEEVAESVYKAYCKTVLEGTADFNMLYAVRQFQECKIFYTEELNLALDMLDEYDAYIGQGHFLDQFIFGYNRESWHLWDHRQEGPRG